MTLNICINRLQLFKRINSCIFCSKPVEPQANLNAIAVSPEKAELPKKIKNDSKSKPKKNVGIRKHLREINQFFDENPRITYYKHFLPSKVLKSRNYKNPEYLYLVCPDIARKIAQAVSQRLQGKHQVLAESNPGFGLITEALLHLGVPSVRLYELNIEFQEYLQETFKEKTDQVALYKKDFFTIWRYAYLDYIDQGQRVPGLLKGVPKKSWTDDPVMTVVGTITKITFLKYLLKSIVLQRDLATFGRIDLFLITYEKYFKVFTATKDDSTLLYKSMTILIEMFFEAELLEKYSRKYFVPWETAKTKRRISNLDGDHLCLMKVTMKKEFPLHADQFVPFYCFMITLFARGNTSIVSTCEKWVPGCGENLILPKLAHSDYPENLDIFTRFRELGPTQILAVFKELSSHPNYASSPFMDMVEQEWLKTETIDTDINDAHNKTAA